MPKTDFEKAASNFGNYRASNKSLTLLPDGYRFFFQDTGDLITCTNTYVGDSTLEVTGSTTVQPPFPRPPIRPHDCLRGRPPKANS